MTGDLADESPLLVEIHALEVRLIIGEDLVGLGNDPNLRGISKKKKKSSSILGVIHMPRSCHLQLRVVGGTGRASV